MNDHIAYVGQRSVWGGTKPFGLCRADRRQHTYIVGKTGTGKSTLVRNLILQDIEAGEGVGLIDPHGDLADEILDYIPRRRSRDVVYFNPSDEGFPPAFNILKGEGRAVVPLMASGVVGAFKGIWGDSWGPRLELILYAAIAALGECDNTSLLGVQRMLIDDRYRDWVLKGVRDTSVRSYWLREFAGYDRRFAAEAVAPIQNKVGQLLMSPLLRNILGQVRRTIDPRSMMDRGQIFIANLAKGRLGEDKANLLGALLVAQFEHAALSRADTPEGERRDFFLFVDEFQNFATNSFASTLSEARKYRLCLTLSHQYLAQIRDDIRDAVLGNVGNLIAFRVGESDARVLEREFGGAYHHSQFTDLPNHQVLVKLLDGGAYRDPFHGTTLPPVGRRYGRRDNLIRQSCQRYCTPRAVVEDRVRRWMGR